MQQLEIKKKPKDLKLIILYDKIQCMNFMKTLVSPDMLFRAFFLTSSYIHVALGFFLHDHFERK